MNDISNETVPEKSDRHANIALELEQLLIAFLEGLLVGLKGDHKPEPGINKGFYYNYLKEKHRIGYGLGSRTHHLKTFDDICKDRSAFRRVTKAYSARMRRNLNMSKKVVKRLDPETSIKIETQSLASTLTILDLMVLLRLDDNSDVARKIIELILGTRDEKQTDEDSQIDNQERLALKKQIKEELKKELREELGTLFKGSRQIDDV